MRKKSEIMAIANKLYANLGESYASLLTTKSEEAKTLVSGTFEDAHKAVESIKTSLDILTRGTEADGVSVHQFLSSFKSFEDNGKLDCVELTIKSKLKAEFQYRSTTTIKADENFIGNISEAYRVAVIGLLYNQLGGENVIELNNKIEEICAENDIPIKFAFTLSEKDNFITEIDNEKVVFNVVEAEALNISTLALFQSGDEYSDHISSIAKQNLIDVLKSVQSTTQIIKAGIDMISTLTGVKTKKRAERLIRKSYHKQAVHFNKINSGIGYYEETIEINGVETEIFALLSKSEDGEISVVLNPFDTKTLFTVDYDVVAAVKKAIA